MSILINDLTAKARLYRDAQQLREVFKRVVEEAFSKLRIELAQAQKLVSDETKR